MKKFLLTILALLLPPVAVFVKSGHHWQLYLNVFFCLLFYIPAIIHAVWLVRHEHEPGMPGPEELDYSEDAEKQSRVEPRLDW